jgi:hypothetical protein
MKKVLSLIMIATGMSILSSCDGFLDVKPFSSVDDKSAISNVENATVALTGVYDNLQSANYLGRNFVIFGDVLTDNIFVKPVNSNRFIAEASWQLIKSNADVTDFWNTAYSTINRANNVINAQISGKEESVNQIVGEALTIRAMVHFDLVRLFAQCYGFTADASHLGIPYVVKHNPNNLPSRNTVKEVYDNIIKDLKAAETKVTTGRQAPYTITNWAVKGLLARVYLTMGDYVNAKKYAVDIIAHGPFKLIPSDSYISSWGAVKTTESIFSLAFSNVDYNATNGLGYMFLEKGYGDMLVNPSLSGLFDPSDVRTGLFVKGTGSANLNYTFSNKYPGQGGVPGLDNFNVIRLSEVYLIAAEACARTNEELVAQGYLNDIRKRALSTAPNVTVTGDALISDILLEKRKELAFEGVYFFDLKRLKKSVTGAKINNGNVIVDYPDNKLAWPIPERETDVNPNIKQNEGY